MMAQYTKNALNMFIELQNSNESQLIQHEIPQPSSSYFSVLMMSFIDYQVFAVIIDVTYFIIIYLMVPDAMMWYEEYNGHTKPPGEPMN